MGAIFLFNAFLSGLVTLLIFIHFIIELKKNEFKKRDITLFGIAIIYSIFSIISFLWYTKSFNFLSSDFILILSFTYVIQTISLITILYQSTKNSKVFISLFPYIFIGIIILIDKSFIHLLIPSSLLITLFTFLILEDTHQKSIPSLIIYSSVSLIFYLGFLINKDSLPLLNLGSLAFFIYFIYIFTDQLRKRPEFLHIKPKIIESPIISFLKHFVFLIIITNFIFIGTISIHELGHLGMAKVNSCEDTKIIYELNGLPHTEFFCPEESKINLWILGGLLLPIIIAIVLALSGGTTVKEFSLQIIGFNLIISYLDIIELGFSKIIGIFTSAIGVSLILISLVVLARSRTKPVFEI